MKTKIKRIYYPYWEWECLGMYIDNVELDNEYAKMKYYEFLKDLSFFEFSLINVIKKWPKSCNHFLSNIHINRIAWLGQASAYMGIGITCFYRGGFRLLNNVEKNLANGMAKKYLNLWEGYAEKDK